MIYAVIESKQTAGIAGAEGRVYQMRTRFAQPAPLPTGYTDTVFAGSTRADAQEEGRQEGSPCNPGNDDLGDRAVGFPFSFTIRGIFKGKQREKRDEW